MKETTLKDVPEAQLRIMEEQAYIDDIYKYFDDEQTISRGVNYFGLVRAYEAQLQQRGLKLDDETLLVVAILEQWKQHDANVRREAGVTADVNKGLDYENQPEQIRWARAHARAVKEIAIRDRANKKDGKVQSLEEILRNRVNEMGSRRAD